MQTEQSPNCDKDQAPAKKRGKLAKFQAAAEYFFKETFRRRSKSEYGELFSRGLRDDGSANRAYPWLYMRLLWLFFVLFGFLSLILLLTNNRIGYPTVIFFGGIFVNVPFLVCLYELYPRRDLSLVALIAAMTIGGAVSASLAELGYLALTPSSKWASPFWTGFLEEFSKALLAVAATLLLKKRDPFACFLIAAAVGTGFSVSEDMGYIYHYSQSVTEIDMQWAVQVAVSRGVVSLCTHAVWTAFIGWAFFAFAKPFKNFRFWAVTVSCMLVHALWDFPLDDLWISLIRVVLAVVAAVPVILFILKRRKSVIPSPLRCGGEQLTVSSPERSAILSHRANLTAIFTGALTILFVLGMCAYPAGMRSVYKTFDDPRSFISYVQYGLSLEGDWNRPYDYETQDYAYTTVLGEKTDAVQREVKGGYEYFYYYSLIGNQGATDGETDDSLNDDGSENIQLADGIFPYEIILRIGQKTYACARMQVVRPVNGAVGVDENNNIYYNYYMLNENVKNWIRLDDGRIKVELYDTEIYGLTGVIVLASLAAASFISGAAAYTALKIRARKAKKSENETQT